MTLCKFFAQGTCKYGNNCRFEHPSAGNNRTQSPNRFAKFNISPETIEKDLTNERPQWILSAYSPAKDTPEQLFGGYPREQSFEELRLHYMTGKATGNEQQALNQAQELYATAEQQMQNAVRNVNEAARFIAEGENRHPNRLDICREGTQGAPFGEFLVGRRPRFETAPPPAAASSNPFGAPLNQASSPFGAAPQAGSAFGQPATLGQRPNPFGAPAQQQPAQSTPAFGQPSQPVSAFGQPSQSTSAFGQPAQPSAFGAPPQTTSAFGQASALGAKPSPFGAPAFGQPSQPGAQASAFGQPSQPGAQASAFGQPSQLGQKPNPFASTAGASASPFAAVSGGAGSDAPKANPFGAAPSGQGNAAASNPFAAGSTTQNSNPSPFGQPQGQGQPQAANPFGQPQGQAQTASPFGQPAAPAANPFGSTPQDAAQRPNPFGQNPPQTGGGFASQGGQTQASPSPFGQPAAGGNTPFGQPAANPFGQPAAASSGANPFGSAQPQQAQQAQPSAASGNPYPPGSAKQHPHIDSYSSKGMDGRLSMFKGKSVTYKDDKPGIRAFDGTWSRIWFPDGAPGYYKDTELPSERYDEKTQGQWSAFVQTGTFADGIMPALPPPRECTQWGF